MFRKVAVLTLAAVFLSVGSIITYAQDTSLPTPSEEINTQPVLPQSETQTETTTTTTVISEDTQQTFIKGILVGGIVGLIIGGVFAWLLKDKLI